MTGRSAVEAASAAIPARIARRDVLMLDGPVVGWVVGDIRPDGSLDVPRGDGEDYTAAVTHADSCEHGLAGRPPQLGQRGLRSVIAAEHMAPFPFCTCGVPAAYAPNGRLFDRYRDRLGYRMRTVALVEVWGRVQLESGGVRGARGRVLGICVADDDTPARRDRAQSAARLLGASIVEVDPAARLESDALAHLIPSGAVTPTHREFAHWSRTKALRRWSSPEQIRMLGRFATIGVNLNVLIAILIEIALEALGVPTPVAVAIAVLLALGGFVAMVTALNERNRSVEGFAPPSSPDPALAAGPIPLTLGRRQLDLGRAGIRLSDLGRP